MLLVQINLAVTQLAHPQSLSVCKRHDSYLVSKNALYFLRVPSSCQKLPKRLGHQRSCPTGSFKELLVHIKLAQQTRHLESLSVCKRYEASAKTYHLEWDSIKRQHLCAAFGRTSDVVLY